MNRAAYKYITVISVLLMSVFIFFNWFVIEAGGVIEDEAHSFMTVTTLVNNGADTLSKLSNNAVAITLLLLCGVLKYLCILSSALGIWGIILSIMKDRKSRLINSVQVISTILVLTALVLMLFVNIVSKSVVGGTVSAAPTVWFLIFTLSLVLSYISGYFFSKEN